jgi:hypothetical protein
MNIIDYPELAGDIERKRKERKAWGRRALAWLPRAFRKGTRKWKR